MTISRHVACRAAIFFLVSVLSAAKLEAQVVPTTYSASPYELEFATTAGDDRDYVLGLPSGYVHGSGVLHPLVFFLHGGGNNALAAWNQRADLRAIADTYNIIMVFPEGHNDYPLTATSGSGFTWNAAHCCFDAKFHDVDDVGFIRQLTEHLSASLDVDTDRIHATGFSNGAMMTHRIGAELADLFASIAPVGGSAGGYQANRDDYDFYPAIAALFSWSNTPLPDPPGVDWNVEESVAPLQPIPVLMVRGVQDELVPDTGGTISFPCIGAWCWAWWSYALPAYPYPGVTLNTDWEIWRSANGCLALPPVQFFYPDGYGGLNFGGDIIACVALLPNQAALRLVMLADMEHQWPTVANSGYDGADRVMNFFRNHPK